MNNKRHISISELESDLLYLGLLAKSHEIYAELGSHAAVSYVRSSYRLLSKVYHPDINPNYPRKAQITQQSLNRIKEQIKKLSDDQIARIIKQGLPEKPPSKTNILLIDNEPMVLNVIKQLLLLEGYECITAKNSEDGFKQYMNHRPNLIICDIVMPWIDGPELIQRLRRVSPKLKTIYISGFLEIGDLRRRVEQETRTYQYRLLEKPIKPSVLLSTIDEYLSEEIGQYIGIDTKA